VRLLLFGSRTWDRPDVIWDCLDILAAQAATAREDELLVVHGACFPKPDEATGEMPLRSADYLADLWVRRRRRVVPPLPVRVERHPADWRRYGRAAGPIRDRHMASLGADFALGFIRDNSAGSTQMNRFAEEADIPVKTVDYSDLPPLTLTEKTHA
jgi:hypothetical protein